MRARHGAIRAYHCDSEDHYPGCPGEILWRSLNAWTHSSLGSFSSKGRVLAVIVASVCVCSCVVQSSTFERTISSSSPLLLRVAHMAEARFQTTQLPYSVDLDQLARECRDLPTRPSYSLSIHPDAYQAVKKRCAGVMSASDHQNQAITMEEADHAWKCRRMSQGLDLKKQATSRTPASFSFDTYVQHFVSHSQLR